MVLVTQLVLCNYSHQLELTIFLINLWYLLCVSGQIDKFCQADFRLSTFFLVLEIYLVGISILFFISCILFSCDAGWAEIVPLSSLTKTSDWCQDYSLSSIRREERGELHSSSLESLEPHIKWQSKFDQDYKFYTISASQADYNAIYCFSQGHQLQLVVTPANMICLEYF